MASTGILNTPLSLFPAAHSTSADSSASGFTRAGATKGQSSKAMDSSRNIVDEQAFIDAYDEYADALFRHCYFRIGSREVGRDLMQETYVRVWEYVCRGNEIDNMRAFLYRTANNLIVDHMRRQKRRKHASLDVLQESGYDPPADEDSRNRVEQSMADDQVGELIAQIEEPYRSAVILRYIDQLSPSEIADMQGVSANVVSVRVNRGMKKLRSLIKKT